MKKSFGICEISNKLYSRLRFWILTMTDREDQPYGRICLFGTTMDYEFQGNDVFLTTDDGNQRVGTIDGLTVTLDDGRTLSLQAV